MKIPEYSRNQLASQAVGVPQQDRSGQILAQGIQEGVSAVAKLWGQRQEEKSNIAAMSTLNDFHTQVMTAQEKTARELRNAPDQYVTTMTDTTDRIISDLSKGLDPTAATKFQQSAAGSKVAYTQHWNKWSFDRDNEIISGKIEGLYQSAASFAEKSQNPQAFKTHMANFAVVESQAKKFWSEQSVMAKSKAYVEQSKKAFIANQIMSNTMPFLAELAKPDGGGYKELLDSAEQKTAQYQAISYNQLKQQMKAFQYGISSIAEINSLQTQALTGSLDLGDINRRIEWAEKNVNKTDSSGAVLVTPTYVEELKNVRQNFLQVSGEKPQVTAMSKEVKRRFDADLATFLNSKESKRGPESYDNVLRLYGGAAHMYRNGDIDSGTLDQVRSTLEKITKNRVGKGEQVDDLYTVAKNAGNYGWFNNPNDIFAKGYAAIENRVNKMTAYTPDQQSKIKLDYLAEFTRQVDQLSPEVKDIVIKKKAGDAIAKQMDLIFNGDGKTSKGMFNYLDAMDPVTQKTYAVGTPYDADHTVIDIAEDGTPILQRNSDVNKLLGNR